MDDPETLSPRERRDHYHAELAKVKLAQLRGELVLKVEADAALARQALAVIELLEQACERYPAATREAVQWVRNEMAGRGF